MSLSDEQKKYPICDTDVWVKSSKHKLHYDEDLLFNLYDNVYIPDAVRQELGRVDREDYIEDFQHGLDMYKICYANKQILSMSYCNDDIFNEDERRSILKAFAEFQIYYDLLHNRFLGTKSSVGEKVAAIYASVLDIPIILSDDGLGKKFISQWYGFLTVINFYEILRLNHYNGSELEEVRKLDNKALKEVVATKEKVKVSKSTLSSYKRKFGFN